MARAGMLSGCGPGSGGVGGVGVLCFGIVCRCWLAELRSFVRRLRCLLSAAVRGVCSLLGVDWKFGCAIGQMVWASSWYAFNIVMVYFAALSTWAGVVLVEDEISGRCLVVF